MEKDVVMKQANKKKEKAHVERECDDVESEAVLADPGVSVTTVRGWV